MPPQAASPQANSSIPSQARDINSTGEAVESLTPELVIALCGPIGSPLHQTATQIRNALNEFNYRSEVIRLSNLIKLNAKNVSATVDASTKFKEIESLINIGDALRKKYGPDVLAKLAIAKIGADRENSFGAFEDVADEETKEERAKIKNQRICHIIDSVKNSAELDLLRLIYGDALFSVGVFSPPELRTENLARPGNLSLEEIERLVDKDSGEEFSHGQSVRDTFPKCDFFLRVDHSITGPTESTAISQITGQIRRFLDLIFKTSIITPTSEEKAMYAATSAAKNSACLSRQVGAAVTSASGELLAVGWNDVPQSGGSLYGMPPIFTEVHKLTTRGDQRCFAQQGQLCHNDKEKKIISERIADCLVEAEILPKESRDRAASAIIKDSRVKDLIEFSRAVHAEMHAILTASRISGDRVVGGKIYVTTYPCHSCARHIIAAGISEVQYIEPYRKSLATRLHKDDLTEAMGEDGKVKIRQYEGIAPRRFIEMFDGNSRKSNGVLTLKGRMEASPLTQVSLKAIPRLEEVVVAEIQTKDLQLHALSTQE